MRGPVLGWQKLAKCARTHAKIEGVTELPWDDVQIFLAIAEEGSLSRAAKRLRVGQPTMSRRLGDLEQRLGFPIFQRTADGVVLTTAGERLLAPARKMAEWAGEVARAAAQGETGGPRGLVRITAPPSVSFDFVAPFAVTVREKLPDVQLDVVSTPRVLDLSRGEADIALRYGAPTSRELVSMGSVSLPNAVVAARSYAARLAKKPRLADLDWIAWGHPFEDVSPNPELAALVPDLKPVFTADNYLVQWRACEAGVGAMLRGHRFSFPSPVVALDIDLGAQASSTLHLVCARSAVAVPRVRAVAEMVLAALESEERR